MTDRATQIAQEFNARVAQIRRSVDLTDEAKRRKISEAYAQAEPEYREAVAEAERKIHERADKAEKAVFAFGYPLSATEEEKAQLRALGRGAYESVHGSLLFTEPEEAREELERLLTRAERTGDPELARAVYHVATERGERSVADSYLEKRPQEKKRWEEYVSARQEVEDLNSPMGILGRAMGDRLFKPPELQGYTSGGTSEDFAAAYTEHLTGRDPAA